jgi:hypothetical protein
VHVPAGCKACNGSRAYIHFVRSGGGNDLVTSLVVGEDGHIFTVDVLARLRAYSKAFEPEWDIPIAPHPGEAVSRRVQFGQDGDLFATGWLEKVPLPAKPSSWIARYSSSGELRWDRPLTEACAGNDIMPTEDGGAFLVESCGGSAVEELRLAVRRISPDGAVLWTDEIFGPYPILRAGFRLAPGPSGDAVVSYVVSESFLAGTSAQVGLNLQAFAARVDANGNTAWQTRLNSTGNSAEAARLVALPHERWAVAGIEYPSRGIRLQYPVTLWFVNGTGAIERRVAVNASDGDYFLVNAIYATADAGLVVGGPITRYTGDSQSPLYQRDYAYWANDSYLMKFDGWGNFQWMRLYGSPHYDTIFDAVPSADGNITAVGVMGADLSPMAENWILRTDFWGRTCGMRLGVCADKSWQDCEDGNPCTINWCDPDEGCTAPPLPDGSPCGDGLTCQGAVCK